MHSDQTITDLFEKQARLYPGKIAITDTKSSLSYQALNEQAEQFSQRLQRQYNVTPGDCVALTVFRKTNDLLVAILGILKAKAAYVPINAELPRSACNDILTAIQPKCLVTQASGSQNKIELVCLPSSMTQHQARPFTIAEANIAYAMYTSGTTGKPKGSFYHS